MKRMHRHNNLKIGLMICIICCTRGIGCATPLSDEEMYLDPTLITPSNYAYNYYSPGYTATFTNVQNLQVLPPLTSGGSAYYFKPTIDYVGDITGTDGSVTFNRPGPYFVMATYTDSTTQLFDYGIGFKVFPEEKGPTYNWERIDTPSPDVVVTDPSLAETNPEFPAGTIEVNDMLSWDDVTNYLKTLNNEHVELGGHGASGQFYYNGSLVLDDSTQATKDWIDSMKGHINYLTFMSCFTGAGEEGSAFLQEVADRLGKSGGYTDAVAGNGTDWFINGDGVFKVVTPEPTSSLLFFLGLAGITGLRKKR